MKLLDNKKLYEIAMSISENAQDLNLKLEVRLELYSCKMVTNDKKEWKKSIKCPVEGRELQPLSPPEDCLSVSPHSRLRHLSEMSNSGCSDNDAEDGGGQVILVSAVSRRTLFNILALLNQCYPDYDFSHTKSDAFRNVIYQKCMACVDDRFVATVHNYSRFRDPLWQTVDEAIKVAECSIYSYIPGYRSDPFTEDGCIWHFNYLFFNKNLKRFLFFACRALCNEWKGTHPGMDFEDSFPGALDSQSWSSEENYCAVSKPKKPKLFHFGATPNVFAAEH